MNCSSLIILCFITLFSVQDKQFVDFKNEDVKVSVNGEQITIVLPFEILENFHIQSEKIFDNNLIPTEIHFETPNGYKILDYQFSKTQRENLLLGDLKCEVLSKDLEVTLQLKKEPSSSKIPNLKGFLYYQACDDRQCFYPRSFYFNVIIQ